MSILKYICYASLVYMVKCHPFGSQFHNVRNSNVAFQTVFALMILS